MAEIKLQPREQKTLKALSECPEPVKASDLAEAIEDTPLNMGNSLRQLKKQGLAELTDKRAKPWQITEMGNEIAATIDWTALELEHGATAQTTAQTAARATAQALAQNTVIR
jgi:Mn-dependent DtxR family transcriptional regulator